MAYRIVNRFGTLQWEEYEEKPLPERAITEANCTSCGNFGKVAGVSTMKHVRDGYGKVDKTRYLCDKCFMEQVWNKR